MNKMHMMSNTNDLRLVGQGELDGTMTNKEKKMIK